MPIDLKQPDEFTFPSQLPAHPLQSDLIIPPNIVNHELWFNFRLHKYATYPNHPVMFERSVWCIICNKWIPRSDANTKSMRNHVDSKDHKSKLSKETGDANKKVDIMFASGADKSMKIKAEAELKVACAVVKSLKPNTFDDPSFREMIEFYQKHPHLKLPHRTHATNLIDTLYESLKQAMKSLITQAPSIAITSDAATLKHSMFPYVCVTAHFAVNFHMHHLLLGLIPAHGSHTAIVLTDLIETCCKDWSISNIVAMITDNASNYVATGNRLLQGRAQSVFLAEHLRCSVHTLQLVIADAWILKGDPNAKNSIEILPAELRKIFKAVVVKIRNQEKYQLVFAAEQAKQMAAAVQATQSQSTHSTQTTQTNQTNQTMLIDDDELMMERERSYEQADEQEKQSFVEPDHFTFTTKATRLVLHNATRWCSTFEMFDRGDQWMPSINATLSCFNDPVVEHVDIIKQLVFLLRPFAGVTARLQSAQTSTMGVVLAELAGLHQSVKKMLESKKRLTSKTARRVARHLVDGLEERFNLTEAGVFESQRVPVLAAVLDIRMKALRFINDKMRTAAWLLLQQEFDFEFAALSMNEQWKADYEKLYGTHNQTTASPSASPNTNDQDDDEVYSAQSFAGEGKPAAIVIAQTVFAAEVIKYKQVAACGDMKFQPLAWWEANGKNYPVLCSLALRYLVIPPSSAPSESIFSLCSQLNSKDRGSIEKFERFPKIIFARHNLKIVRELGLDLSTVFIAAQQAEKEARRAEQRSSSKRQRVDTGAMQVVLDDEHEEEQVEY